MTQIPLALQAFPLWQGGLQPLPPLSKGGAATAAVGFSENPPTGEPESREGTQKSYDHHKSYSKSVLSNPHSTPSTPVKNIVLRSPQSSPLSTPILLFNLRSSLHCFLTGSSTD